MNLPPLRNPLPRLRAWVQTNRAQAEIMAIAGVAFGLLIIMFVITIVVLYLKLR
jgi:hypothetical protein